MASFLPDTYQQTTQRLQELIIQQSDREFITRQLGTDGVLIQLDIEYPECLECLDNLITS